MIEDTFSSKNGVNFFPLILFCLALSIEEFIAFSIILFGIEYFFGTGLQIKILPFKDNEFDFVLSAGVLHHVNMPIEKMMFLMVGDTGLEPVTSTL